MNEIWKDIPDYEGQYQASTKGRIKSLDRNVWCGGGYRTMRGRILKPGVYNKIGHVSVALGRHNNQSVHVLILVTFKGPRPEGFDGLHLDGNASNNEADNLEWGTRSKNNEMMIYHGLRNFTVEDILFIREHAYDYHGIQTDFAKLFNVKLCAINSIATGRHYNHVK